MLRSAAASAAETLVTWKHSRTSPTFHVIEIGDARAALKPGANFAGVVLEAFQGTELGGVNHGAVTQHANLPVAFEHAIHDVAAGDGAGALDAEGVANFGAAQVGFGDDGLEQAFHGLFNFVGNFVNDGMWVRMSTCSC